MKFQVPQFIETETKLVGPLTLKQFLFVGGGVSIGTVEYLVLNGVVFLVVFLPTIALFGALAFARVGGQPFLNYLAYFLAYTFGSKRYLYRIPHGQ